MILNFLLFVSGIERAGVIHDFVLSPTGYFPEKESTQSSPGDIPRSPFFRNTVLEIRFYLRQRIPRRPVVLLAPGVTPYLAFKIGICAALNGKPCLCTKHEGLRPGAKRKRSPPLVDTPSGVLPALPTQAK